jgi:hypothetical protein
VKDLGKGDPAETSFVEAVEKAMKLANAVDAKLFPVPYNPIFVESFEYECEVFSSDVVDLYLGREKAN